MNASNPSSKVTPPKTESAVSGILSTPRFIILIAVIMAVLAFIGTGVTFAGLPWAQTYWLFLAPIYGIFCILTVSRHKKITGSLVGIQALHWLAVAIAIIIDFIYLHKTGEQTSQATGLSSLLILALGSCLAGIHIERLFAILGLLLFGLVMVIALFQEYFGLAIVIGLLVTLGYFTAAWFIHKKRPEDLPHNAPQ